MRDAIPEAPATQPRRPAWRRWRRSGVVAAVLLAALAVAYHQLAARDRQHARFYQAGQSINGFLGEYCAALEAARQSGRVDPLLAFYHPAYHAPGRGREVWGESRRLAGAEVYPRRRSGTADAGLDELRRELSTYVGELAAIDRTSCKIDLIEALEPGASARLTVKRIVAGSDHRGRRLEDRLFSRWQLVAGADAAGWRIAADRLVEGVRVAAPAASLVAVDPRRLGIDYAHQRNPHVDMKAHRRELKFGVIQHAAGGVAVADYDGDGRPDLLFLDGRRSRLYRNLGPAGGLPRFADVTRDAGLDGIDRAHVGLFADFDNDGDRDLFVGRYLAPNQYWQNAGDGTFTEIGADLGLDLAVPTTAATLLDFDRDGDLDLYLAVNGNAFEAFPRLPFFAQNGEPNRLLRNDGDRFTDVTRASGTGDTGWGLATASGDYDGDGWPDLAVANDFGKKCLYRNNRDGTFTDVAKEAGVLDFGPGMGVAFGDYDGDGWADLYTANVNSNQRWFGEDETVAQYLRNVLRTRYALADAGEYWRVYRLIGSRWWQLGKQIGEGNSLFHNNGDGTFTEQRDSHAERAGWGWGVAFFDLDNDADVDLYAANGWISNTPGTDL
ncbi:MAG: VCBS repeat-containing protein [Acidobacteria bacterium]|nr:MAG: VCBS repeat-containing protein [Acidobacteriota bacterium]